MFTVYVNKGDGWCYTKDCNTESEAKYICCYNEIQGYKADYSKPGQVEREQYD